MNCYETRRELRRAASSAVVGGNDLPDEGRADLRLALR